MPVDDDSPPRDGENPPSPPEEDTLVVVVVPVVVVPVVLAVALILSPRSKACVPYHHHHHLYWYCCCCCYKMAGDDYEAVWNDDEAVQSDQRQWPFEVKKERILRRKPLRQFCAKTKDDDRDEYCRDDADDAQCDGGAVAPDDDVELLLLLLHIAVVGKVVGAMAKTRTWHTVVGL